MTQRCKPHTHAQLPISALSQHEPCSKLMPLLVLSLSGGYGGIRGDLALDPKPECIQAPGLQHVLCTSWRNDNSGK